MSRPVRSLTVLQHWDCQSCTHCCREYRVYVSDDERQCLVALDWSAEADLAGLALVVREGPTWQPRFRLQQRADGACVFLGPQGRCRIHERFGSEAKPFACRMYPFVLAPGGNDWRVGLRFSCPAAAQDQGRPVTDHADEVREFARLLERMQPTTDMPEPPPLQLGQTVAWPDFLRFVDALLVILRSRGEPLERRWRTCLALASLCRQAKFEQVQGKRLQEFLALVGGDLDAEVPEDPGAVPAPSWIGRVLFRQTLAVLIRKEVGPEQGSATRSRVGLLRAAWRFARGTGMVPALHAALPACTFEQLETPLGPLPAEAEAILERYYLAKLESLQFCGAANFGLPLWSGLASLALTLPAILWLVRALAELPRAEAVSRAVRIVDHNFGYHPQLDGRFRRFVLQTLLARGELERLIAWYAR
ncbi:MAG: YkgJ family cysteine cluster protein [Planctomycetia bacterium]|nr:YkgJ family cysteine cluster protein [Planctomycetia bacterium]